MVCRGDRGFPRCSSRQNVAASAHFFSKRVFVEQVAFLECAEDGFAECFHGALGIELVEAVELRFKSRIEERSRRVFDDSSRSMASAASPVYLENL